MIAVCIATYNHESFIAQCIESVLTQVCDDPIRIYIGDDSSTDGTSLICRRYIEKDERIVYIRREKNIGLVGNTIDLYRRIMADGCEYIAMLDGDDYWIDAHKLQLQIDYLRATPECGFVHTDGKVSSNKNTWKFGQREGLYGIDSPGFANCTVMFRTNLLSDSLLREIEKQHFLWLDYPLYGTFYVHTRWAYIPQKTAVWRNHISVSQPDKAVSILRLREERCRMWRWLDTQFPGKVGFCEEEEQNYLYEQRINIIYQFNDKTLCIPELITDYKPRTWKQKLKQKGLKKNIYYFILQKLCKKFA